MKNWKKIAVLLAALVVFAAAFIILNKNQGKLDADSDKTSETDSVNKVDLISIGKDQITKITLKHQDGEIVLTRQEKEVEKENKKDDGTTEKVKEKVKFWVSDDFKADSDAADDIALAADTAVTERLIEEKPQDLSVYGLDKPVTAAFASSDGKEESVEIGNKTPTGDGYYVRKGGTESVYTLDSYKGDQFVSGKFDLLSKNFYDSDDLTVENVTALNFTRSGKALFSSGKTADQWYITSPLPQKRKADTESFPKFINWLAAFRSSEFIEENPSDLGKYGLAEPSYVFDYTIDGKDYTLKLGGKIDSDYYGMIEGYPYVFKVDSSDLNFVDLPLIDLVETFAYIPAIYDVEKLVIEIDGRTDELLINANKDDSSKDEFYFNGKKIEGDDNIKLFRGYYQGAIGIAGDKLDLDAKPSGRAEIRMTYTMREAKPDKVVAVELIPTNDGYGYYLMKNGEYSGMVMGNRQLDDPSMGIRPYYKSLIEGLSKTSSETSTETSSETSSD